MEDDEPVISSGLVITPDTVMNRNFTSAFRGYHPGEVREFLKRVSDEMAASAAREVELRRALQEALARAEDGEKRAADLEARLAGTAEELERVRVQGEAAREELARVLATRTMRWSKQARAVYGRVRDLRPRGVDG